MGEKVLKQLGTPNNKDNMIRLREKIKERYTIEKMVSKTENILTDENNK